MDSEYKRLCDRLNTLEHETRQIDKAIHGFELVIDNFDLDSTEMEHRNTFLMLYGTAVQERRDLYSLRRQTLALIEARKDQ